MQTQYLGIDIGIDRVQVANFGPLRSKSSGSSNSCSFGWRSQWQFGLPIDAGVEPPAEWVDVVCDQLADRLPRCIDGERYCTMLSLPVPWVHYQTNPRDEIERVRKDCDVMFQSSLFASDAHLCHWPAGGGSQLVTVAATATVAASRIADAVNKVGYEVHGILPPVSAILKSAGTLTGMEPVAVVLLERSGGLIATAEDSNCGLCRLAPACSLSSKDVLLDAADLQPWLSETASEVNATLRYAKRLGARIDSQMPVMIAGESAGIANVDSLFATLLGRPVFAWRYAGRHRPRRVNRVGPIRHHHDATLAVSLSLAHCANQQANAMEKRIHHVSHSKRGC